MAVTARTLVAVTAFLEPVCEVTPTRVALRLQVPQTTTFQAMTPGNMALGSFTHRLAALGSVSSEAVMVSFRAVAGPKIAVIGTATVAAMSALTVTVVPMAVRDGHRLGVQVAF